jgi:hypothetical protein
LHLFFFVKGSKPGGVYHSLFLLFGQCYLRFQRTFQSDVDRRMQVAFSFTDLQFSPALLARAAGLRSKLQELHYAATRQIIRHSHS